MDGTLMGNDSMVSPLSAEILNELALEGVKITVATARTPATVEPLLQGINTLAPAIVMTGAAEWNRRLRRFEHPILFQPGQSAALADSFLKCGVRPFVYTIEADSRITVYFNGRMSRLQEKFYRDRSCLELKKFVFNPPDGYGHDFDRAILLLGIDCTPRIEVLARRLKTDPTLSVSSYEDIFNPEISYIEVFAAGVSKASAVLRLKEETGADRLVVYGDNLNDLTMFAVADEAVAVANAHPEVLMAATRTIGPNSASSVALDIRRQALGY